MGVIAFKGNIPDAPGNTLTRLHNKAIIAPISIVNGNNTLWFEVPNTNRAICGTAKPMNATGPQ